jgi:hypothetical protein
VLRVWLIVMFAGASGIFVGSLASTRLLGINQAAPLEPEAHYSGPLFASKQAHEWLQKTITRGYWVNPAMDASRVDFVSLQGKERNAMKPSVAMAANAGRAPQRSRVQL